MKIVALELVNFGKYDQKTIAFTGGLNLIVGPNEAGKSTIQTAIKAAFFGERQGYQRWRRWGSDNPACSLVLDYELADGSAWRLTRDLAKNDVRLEQVKGGDAAAAGSGDVGKMVGSHLGIDTSDAFLNTVFVRVGELATDLKEIEPSLRARVESLLVGTVGGSISGAIKVLNGRYRHLAGTLRDKGAGGEVGELTAKEAEIRSRLAQAEQAEAAKVELAAELEKTETLLAQRTERLKVLSGLVAAVQSKQVLEEKAAGLGDQRKELRRKIERIKDDREKSAAIKAEMAAVQEYTGVTAEDAAALQTKLKDARAKRMELSAATDGGRIGAPAGSDANGTLLLIVGGVGIAAGVGLALFGRMAPGIVLALIGAGAAIVGWLLNRPRQPVVDSRYIYIEEELRRLDDEIKEVLSKTGAADVPTFLAKQNKYDSLTRELANIAHYEAIMLEGSSLEALAKDLDQLVDQAEVIERQLKGSTIAAMTQEEVYERERELAILEPQVADLRRARDTLVGRVQSHRQLSLSPADLKAELDFVIDRLNRTREYASAVQTASSEISAIAAEISGEVAPEISSKASKYVETLTGGRYSQVNLGADLAPSLVGPGGDVVPETLSTGAADQLFFAIRLAAADLISGETRPPIILDDPFVYFDSDRLKAAGDIVAELAADRQVILFTHDTVYKDWPGKTIKLT